MVTEKVVKSKRPQKYAKKRPCANLSFDPKKLYTKFHKNPLISFAVIVRADARTDGQD